MTGCSNGGEPSDCALLDVTAAVGRLNKNFSEKNILPLIPLWGSAGTYLQEVGKCLPH